MTLKLGRKNAGKNVWLLQIVVILKSFHSKIFLGYDVVRDDDWEKVTS